MDLLKPKWCAWTGSLALLLLSFPVQGARPEYQVKAAILYKFAVFVEWPARTFPSDTSPFLACVLGKDPFGPWLQKEMGEAKVGTHPVEIRQMEPGEAAGGCQLVFIGATESSRLPKILPFLHGRSTLITSDVSDVNEFCRLGGMICLVMVEGKVRFQLNSKAIEKAGLKIDSKLKRVALSADCGEAK